MKKAEHTLPEGYRKIYSVDMQKDRKMLLLINGIALVVALAMVIPMHFYIPFFTLFDMSQGIGKYLLRWCVILVLMVGYIFAHELVHGITMKLFGTKKVRYGFTGAYAFAASDDYYPKIPYIIIALAPIVVWGIVLAVVNALIPVEWFWTVYFIQVLNVSGAAGDLYVTLKFLKMPKDILVSDSGVSMAVYSADYVD